MSNNTGFFTCNRMCWIIGALLGFAALLLAQGRLGFHFILALIVGLIVMFGVAWFLKKNFCADVAEGSSASTGAAIAGAGVATAAAASSASASTSAASESTPAAAASMPASALDAATAAETPAPVKEAPKPAAAKPAAKPTAKKPAAKKAAAKKPAAKAAKPAAKATKPAAKAAAKPAAPTGKPKKPRTMKAARKSGADDLKQLKGVGPKLEQTLNGLGFWHFDQVAKWGPDEIMWVDDNLSFKGRIERDGWVEQAKTLAEGGETAFSKKVKKGEVY
ncbi:NADH:quinone oxidoreductase [Aliiroseovarius sp. 2305UL8-7]|uniref:NADH:quinone oxidoreductase n=1 Tax=Aliiroseovarius conchicola TaxID=3121637 RepID=UPI003528C0EF